MLILMNAFTDVVGVVIAKLRAFLFIFLYVVLDYTGFSTQVFISVVTLG